ncbi:alpha- -glucan [Pyrrhoderma noxium]|uniref:Alpha--glucan n=1 Tax=Pyrrhoderma noxium TaxID=2282107 RepID=A0A286UJB1_9AGAM|nr:alpha- -glucan [Pyrrhoderma noxium]
MTDLTFCHLHMTNRDMLIFETFENTKTYLSGELSDEELEIPAHEIPPNPDDSDVLPSQVHPSYPYGNPTNLKHPASRPRKPTDPSSRALFADLAYAGGGVNGALRWRDLALDRLLPVDRAREEAARAAMARKMASGASQSNGPSAAPAATQETETETDAVHQTEEEEGEAEDEDSEPNASASEEEEDNETNIEASIEE